MALSVVCNGNQRKDYLGFIAEFWNNNKFFLLTGQRGFILITAGIVYCIYCVGLLFSSACADVTPCAGGAYIP
jgi:hypothetical protein